MVLEMVGTSNFKAMQWHKYLLKAIFDTHFLTAILHRGLRNCFFFLFANFPYSIWTFISFFYLDFYFPFLFPFSIRTFIFLYFSIFFQFFSNFFFNFFLFYCHHILDFFQIFHLKGVLQKKPFGLRSYFYAKSWLDFCLSFRRA